MKEYPADSSCPTAAEVHLAHNWFVSRRGGERTVEEIARLFPEAGISTLFLKRDTLPEKFRRRVFQVSPLGRLAPRFCDHRVLLPFYGWATRRLSAPEGTRLLISSDASVVKGMRKPPGCVHVCYCHSPPRYLWDMSEEYLARTGGIGGIGRWLFRRTIPRLREFDRSAAENVDHFIANSRFVAERIRRIYGRDAAVVYPPVDTARFAVTPAPKRGEGYYLVISELVAYKRVDLAAGACARSGRKLVVVGDGPEGARLRRGFAGAVEFCGRVPDEEVAKLLAGCRALIHPQLEDFGITAVEAQAAGRPVVAYRGGGAMETVVDGETGLFFDEQTEDSLNAVLNQLEARPDGFSAEACRRQAQRFAPEVFREGLRKTLAGWVPAGVIKSAPSIGAF